MSKLAAAFGIDATATTTTTPDGTMPDGFEVSDGNATLDVTTEGGTTAVSYSLGGPATSGGSPGSAGSSGSGGSVSSGGATTGPSTGPNSPVTVEPPTDLPVPPDVDTSTTLPEKLAPVDVPTAEQAESTARDLLDRAGVLAGGQWTSEVTDSGGIAISCAVGQECTDTPGEVTARDVTLSLNVDGVRVDGISWTVTVGEHSRIESAYGEWASPVSLGTYALRTTASAFSALQHGEANFGGVEPVAGGVPETAPGETSTASVPPGDTGTLATSPTTDTSPSTTPPRQLTPKLPSRST